MDAESRVDSFMTPLDAELAKAYLESHGIPVRLEGEEILGVAFALGPVLGGIRLFVEKEDGETAGLLLERYHRALLDQSEPKVESPDERVSRAWVSAFVGFVTLPLLVHAYSVWLLMHVKSRNLSIRARKRYVVAWMVNALAFGIAGWALLRVIG